MHNRPNEKKFDCPACGMMSFPSKTGVFSPSKEASNKTAPSTPASENTSENSLGGCPACGMMSFTPNGPR